VPEDAATPAPHDAPSAQGDPGEAGGGGAVVAAISREVVQVHARYYGRGPTKAKTIWRDDVVVCVMEDVFTKAEQLLVENGRFEDVRSHRTAFQDQVEPLFRDAIETATGRRVKSFLSQIAEDGAACEMFILGGPIGEGSDRTG
jgi:uncharacterized protein YbcI